MNSLLAFVLGIAVVFFGYRVYAQWVDRRVIRPDSKRTTPASMYMDGVDFIPTSKNVLFGYQFKSIAGAAPVVGAIMAAQWGWLPAMLWLFVGACFFGWIHDYSSAMVSVRSDGMTFGGLSHRLLSPRARLILMAFIYFYLLLVAGAFGAIVAGLLAKQGAAVLGLVVLTAAGVLAGQMIYRWKRDIVLTSVVTVSLAVAGIVAGAYLPASLFMGKLAGNATFWALFTFLFCYLGAALPIWRFAQPVNYVAFYIVFLGLIGGALGAIVGHPQFTLPAFTQPVIAIGPIWPMLFVTLACGAVSGWHSLVSSSGTARQLESEADARPVTAGSMFAEMLLGLLALIAAAVAFKSWHEYAEMMKPGGPGAGGVFAAGMGKLLGFIGVPVELGATFAAVLIVVLAITVMQLVLRFMRIATSELVGDILPPLRTVHVATIVAALLAFLLVETGWWQYLWVLFGGANQLMASLALLLVTVWLMNEGRSVIFTAIPMAFMFVTTIGALAFTAYQLLKKVLEGQVAGGALAGNALMAVVAIFLIAAALSLAADGLRALARLRRAGGAGAEAAAVK
jgi:carbon starvation protein